MIIEDEYSKYFNPLNILFKKIAKHLRWCSGAVEDIRFTAFSWAKLAEDRSAVFFYNRYGTAVASLDLKDFATKEYLQGYANKSSLEELSTYTCDSILQFSDSISVLNATSELISSDVLQLSSSMQEVSGDVENISSLMFQLSDLISSLSISLSGFKNQIELSILSIDSRLQAVESRLSNLN